MNQPRADKAYPLLLRGLDVSAPELLVFDHPADMVQLPKGSFEPGECPVEACRRELFEETGVDSVSMVADLGTVDLIAPRRSIEHLHEEPQRWHLIVFTTDTKTPEAWSHRPTGGAGEEGLVFRCRWVKLELAQSELHGFYTPAVRALENWWQLARNR